MERIKYSFLTILNLILFNKMILKNLFAKRLIALMGMVFTTTSLLYSQIDNVDFLRSGAVDGTTLTEAYVTPWANAFGAGVNGNWYNTAKPHKFLGFDITLGVTVGIVPSSDNTYDVSKIGLKNFTGSGMSPTISGPDHEGPVLTGPSVNGIAPITFHTPPGTNWKYMPVPTLQAGIGLPLGSELKVRYIPKVGVGNVDVSSWGLGLIHSIIQYFPGNDLLPFDVSLFGGYNVLNGNVGITLGPDPTKIHNYSSAYAGEDWNQNFGVEVEAWNASVIGSLNLRIITLYGGLGYTKTRTQVQMTGNFPMPTVNPALSINDYVYEDAGVMKNFPDMDIKNYSGLRTNIGLRLKFTFFTIHGDYTWAQYSVLSTGFGFSFR